MFNFYDYLSGAFSFGLKTIGNRTYEWLCGMENWGGGYSFVYLIGWIFPFPHSSIWEQIFWQPVLAELLLLLRLRNQSFLSFIYSFKEVRKSGQPRGQFPLCLKVIAVVH